MHYTTSTLVSLALYFGLAISAPLKLAVPVHARQSAACFLVGTTVLPAEVQDAADALANTITCDASTTTIGTVPDVTAAGTSFSSINFADSSSTPLQFALDTFATADPVASTDLAQFQNNLDVYVATEAGIRSESGSLAIKVPKFFLSFQVARIKTAQGTAITDPGQTVEHLLGKVLNNSKGEDQALLDQVTALSKVLA
jgi:hypothetical protein